MAAFERKAAHACPIRWGGLILPRPKDVQIAGAQIARTWTPYRVFFRRPQSHCKLFFHSNCAQWHPLL